MLKLSRRAIMRASAVSLLAMVGCGPSTAAPTPGVAPTAAPKPGVAPTAAPKPGVAPTAAPAAPPAAKAAATSPAASAGAAPRLSAAEWQAMVTAARREGKVVVKGPPGANNRDALAQGFVQRYPDIQVDFTGGTGPAVTQPLLTERQAGQYTTDLLITGTTVPIVNLLPANALDPMPPYLVGPESDPSLWAGGKLDFADEANQYNLAFSLYVAPPLGINPTVIPPGTFRSYKDLLDPKWKGKVSMYDPRISGGGEATARFWYTEPSLGKEFLRDLLTSGVALTRDYRQMTDWIAHGQYPVAVAPSIVTVMEFVAKGLPVQLSSAQDLKEGSYVQAGFGSVVVLNRAPHPNAAKVYLDWLLSREGQTAWSKASGYPSQRKDVPVDHVLPALIPQPGVKYDENYKERSLRAGPEVAAFVTSIVGT